MSLSYRYINPLVQFGEVNYDLIIEDLEDDSFEPVRVQKTFNVEEDAIDSDFLFKEAKKEINVIQNYVAQDATEESKING